MALKKHTKKWQPSAVGHSATPFPVKQDWNPRFLETGYRFLFVVFCVLFLGIVNHDYLFIVQEYNLFLADRMFFVSYIDHVGGMLQYTARFLTQSFVFPFWGAFFLTTILLLIQTLTAKAFRLNGAWTVLSFLPSFLLVRLFTQLEYRVFDSIIYLDDLYGCVVGTLLALLFVVVYAALPRPNGRLAFGVVGVVVLFGVAGVFGLLGLLLCVIREFRFPNTGRRMLRQELLIFAGLLTPSTYYLFFVPAPMSRVFFIGIPVVLGWDTSYSTFVLLLTTPICLALFDVLRGNRTVSVSTTSLTVGAIVFSLLAGVVVAFSHANAEFSTTVKMCRLLKQRDWEGVLRVRFDDPEPIGLIVWMRNLALFKLERLGDEAFTFPQRSKHNALIDKIKYPFMYGNNILYEFGFVNTAFKIAHNLYVSKGPNRNCLETFALCALVNGETDLAVRYLHLMKRAPLLKNLAKNWETSKKIETEIASIRRLIPTEDRFERPFASLVPLIFEGFSGRNFDTSPPDVQDMLLFLSLLRKDLKTFQKDVDRRSGQNENRRIPKHFQEAILLGSTDLPADVEKYHLSPEIVRQFEAFRKARFPTESLRMEFGNTYWAYHSFSSDFP